MAVVAACVVPPPPSPGGCCRPIFPNSFSERHQGFSFQPDENAAGENAEKEPAPPEPPEEDGKRHGFLILSREDSTMVRPPAGDGIVVRGAHWGAVAAKGPAARCCAARDGCHRLPVAPCRLLHWLWCLVSPRGCRVRPPPPSDPSDGAGDHGAGHQRLCHAGSHRLCRQHRREPLHRPGVAVGHPAAGRRWVLAEVGGTRGCCGPHTTPSLSTPPLSIPLTSPRPQ